MMQSLIDTEPYFLHISISEQLMFVYKNGQLTVQYPISTAKNGAGEIENSECTPRGLHIIRAKIGQSAVPNSVFVGRRETGEIYTESLLDQFPGRDWILTRILWLSGLEPGKNRSGNVDTMRRYVYIHGTPDSIPMGRPGSRGCVRMRNQDIIALFDGVPAYAKVLITDAFEPITA